MNILLLIVLVMLLLLQILMGYNIHEGSYGFAASNFVTCQMFLVILNHILRDK